MKDPRERDVQPAPKVSDERSGSSRPPRRGPPRKGPPPKKDERPRLPAWQFKQAQEMADKSGIPLAWAVKVVTKETTLAAALQQLQLRDKLDSLKQRGLLTAAFVHQVQSGNLTLDEALFMVRLRARKQSEDYRYCHLDEYFQQGKPVALAAVEKKILSGTITISNKYDITLKPQEGDDIFLNKHNIKFYFPPSDRKQVLKQVTWGDKDRAIETDFLKDRTKRKKVKARQLLEAQEADRALTWHTVEGDVVRGKIVWFGVYEVVLETSRKNRIVVMRHAVEKVE